MAWRASHRFARISPSKVKLIIDMVRGKRAAEAMDQLSFMPQRAAKFVRKVLQSAVANANEQEADVDRLYITEARVDPGPMLKRIQPKDRGRAYLIRRRMSHIHIVVDEK